MFVCRVAGYHDVSARVLAISCKLINLNQLKRKFSNNTLNKFLNKDFDVSVSVRLD